MRSISFFSFLFLLLFSGFGCSDREQTKVQKMDLVQGVYASGNVQPVGYYQVTSKVSGVLDRISVEVGQEVKAGTPLVKLQNEPNERNLQIAKNQLELAQNNAQPDSDLLRQLRQQVESARAVFRQDSLDLIRYQELQEELIGSRQQLESAALKYQTSLNSYQIALSKLNETQDRLQIELKNARNNYLAQQSLTGDYTILSAMDGTVYNIDPKPGELIAANQPIMEIGASNRFETELQVDETDIIMVKPGQQVFYELDAVEDTVLSGTISLIYPKVDPIERTAKVVATIDSSGYQMFPGMSLEANIVINKKEGILILPVTYVTETNEVILEDRTRKRIETGIRDLNYVEIISGLEEGDVVIKPES